MSKQIQIERRAKWESLIKEQEKSGQTPSGFCKERNLAFHQFSYYRRFINKLVRNKSDTSNSFSPVQLKKYDPIISNEIRIILPNGFQCIVPSQSDIHQVKQLIGALLSC